MKMGVAAMERELLLRQEKINSLRRRERYLRHTNALMKAELNSSCIGIAGLIRSDRELRRAA